MPRSATTPTTRCASTATRSGPRWSARAPISGSPSAAASPMRWAAAGSTPTRSTIPAGVDLSDHEVNIKILVDRAIAVGRALGGRARALLGSMTEDVAALVLRDNYLQGQALSVAEARGAADARSAATADPRAGTRRTASTARSSFCPTTSTIARRAAHGAGWSVPSSRSCSPMPRCRSTPSCCAPTCPTPRNWPTSCAAISRSRCATGSVRRSAPTRCAARSPPPSLPMTSSIAPASPLSTTCRRAPVARRPRPHAPT